jgi:hypothetical protein
MIVAGGIKDLGYVCFVRKLCAVQSIHTGLADLYSQKVISGMVYLAGFRSAELFSPEDVE